MLSGFLIYIETWVVFRYDDMKKLSEIFRSSQVETQEDATGLDKTFKEGEKTFRDLQKFTG